MTVPMVAVVARLVPIKGHAYLLRALKLVAEEGVMLGAAFFGDGQMRASLEVLARNLGIAQNVFFLGFKKEPRRYAQAFEGVVLPSLSEGFPLALVEAMLEGLPVVATKVGGVEDLVRDGEEGWLCAPADPSALASLMLELVRNPEQARAMGQKGRLKVSGQFTLDIHREKLFSIYRELCKG
jgi:glycosyltransferase involved in cell wall biosynthesis